MMPYSMITVTYHMYNDDHVAETCIDLQVEYDTAEILVSGKHCAQATRTTAAIETIVNRLAILQGYNQAKIQDIRYAKERL